MSTTTLHRLYNGSTSPLRRLYHCPCSRPYDRLYDGSATVLQTALQRPYEWLCNSSTIGSTTALPSPIQSFVRTALHHLYKRFCNGSTNSSTNSSTISCIAALRAILQRFSSSTSSVQTGLQRLRGSRARSSVQKLSRAYITTRTQPPRTQPPRIQPPHIQPPRTQPLLLLYGSPP